MDHKEIYKAMAEKEAEARNSATVTQFKQLVIDGAVTFEQLQELSSIAYEKEQINDARTSHEHN